MRKLLGLALAVAAIGFVASPSEARAAEANISRAAGGTVYEAAPQWRRRGRRYNRRVRVVNRTRLVRVGRRVYRETYQIRYWPNGRTQTHLISRVRVR